MNFDLTRWCVRLLDIKCNDVEWMNHIRSTKIEAVKNGYSENDVSQELMRINSERKQKLSESHQDSAPEPDCEPEHKPVNNTPKFKPDTRKIHLNPNRDLHDSGVKIKSSGYRGMSILEMAVQKNH